MSAATAPVDQTDESPPPPPPASEPLRALPTPFLTKTYQMVEDPAVNDVISWNEDGSTFVVWRPAEFALDLLPKYFKHNNFSSFVRQLNTYGFRKIVPDRWEFSNEFFRRGEKRMLCDIHRKKFSLPTVAVAVAVPVPVPSALVIPAYHSGSPANRSGSSTNSGEFQLEQVNFSSSLPEVTTGSAAAPPGSTVELVDENERLRKENQKLASELTQMKNICNSIFVLMSKYATGQRCEQPPLEALELMPVSRILEEAEEICVKFDEPMLSLTGATGSSSWYYDASPMLFGVSIGEKRYREENDGEEEQTATTNPPEVKLEPESFHLLETETAAAEEEDQQPWVVYCPRPQRACNGNGREFMKPDGEHVI